KWEETLPSGLPRDPFQDSVKITCVEVRPEPGYLYTYRASSYHAVRAARKLVKSCITQQRAAPDMTNDRVPIAELTVAKRQGQSGAFYVPVWEVMDWQPADVILRMLAKTGQSSELAELGISPKEAINEDLGDEPKAKPAPAKKPARSSRFA